MAKQVSGITDTCIAVTASLLPLLQQRSCSRKTPLCSKIKYYKDETSGYCISAIRDRAKQTLVLIVLEPQQEPRFEANRYGFRLERSIQDAVYSFRSGLSHYPKYVFDVDLEGCYANIFDQAIIISKLDCIPEIKDLVHSWLKAGSLQPDVVLSSSKRNLEPPKADSYNLYQPI